MKIRNLLFLAVIVIVVIVLALTGGDNNVISVRITEVGTQSITQSVSAIGRIEPETEIKFLVVYR